MQLQQECCRQCNARDVVTASNQDLHAASRMRVYVLAVKDD